MRLIVCLMTATMMGACASGHLAPHGNQPAIRAGTTVIAMAIVPATTPGTTTCRAKVSRENAAVSKNKPVVWEIVDLCNENEQTVEVRFTTGELKQHLTPRRQKGKIKKGQADHLEWEVSKKASPGQYADYQIWLGDEMLVDPRIQVP
jgi:hypothetical protein